MTGAAHAAAGGHVPNGGSAIVLLLACATVGAAAGGASLDGRRTGFLGMVAALCGGQLLGHLALAVDSGHHSEHGLLLTAPMLAMHVAGAIAVALVIGLVEYLYIVSSSVLRWLRLFAARHARRWPSAVPMSTPSVVLQPILISCGLGMRAPPRPAIAA
jgi:hypothetical protein